MEPETNQPSTSQPGNLLETIKNYIKLNYEPTARMGTDVITLSTAELYEKLTDVYPGEYSQKDVAEWMHEWGFKLTEIGVLKLEWMLKAS